MGSRVAVKTLEVSAARRVWTVTAMCLILLPIIAPVTGISVAGPDISLATGATQDQVTWIVDAYTLGLAVALLPAGALGDRFGRRGVMQVGLVLYVMFSLGPLFIESPEWLIVVRLLAGLAAGIAMPSTLSIITSIYPPGGRDRAVGVWAGFVVVNSAVGITTFGALTEFVDWRSVFWLAFGMGVLGLGVALTVPTSRDDDPPSFDLAGALTSVAAVGITIYALIEAPHRGWTNPMTLGLLTLGLGMFAVFVLVELWARDPLLDVRLFMIREFGVSSLALLAQFVVLFGSFYLTVLYVQYVYGYGPFQAGLAITPMAVTILPLTIFASVSWGLRRVLIAGCVLSACSLGALLWTDVDAGYGIVLISVLFIGAGAGISTGPATAAVVDNVSEEKQGVASAVNHTTREVGTALGFAFFGSMLSSGYLRGIEDSTATLPAPARSASRDSIVAALQVAQQSGPGGAQLAADARAAFVTGVHQAAIAGIALMVVSVALIWFFGPRSVSPVRVRPAEPGIELIRGRVSIATGAPVAAAGITLIDNTGRQLGRCRTDDDGLYSLPLPSVRDFQVVCARAGLRPYTAQATQNGDGIVEHDVVLAEVGFLAGRVGFCGPLPSGHMVTVLDPIGANGGGEYPVHETLDVSAGSWMLHDVRRPEGARLTGTVYNGLNGIPVAGASVTVLDDRGNPVTTVRTSTGGSFDVSGLPVGSCTVQVTHLDGAPAVVSLSSGAPPRETLTLRPVDEIWQSNGGARSADISEDLGPEGLS